MNEDRLVKALFEHKQEILRLRDLISRHGDHILKREVGVCTCDGDYDKYCHIHGKNSKGKENMRSIEEHKVTVTREENDHWEIGAIYLIRTVTMIDTGVLVAVTEKELVLEQAAWIADTGRFADALKNCNFMEVEPFPDGQVIVGRGAIIDAVKIPKVQRDQK